MYRHEAQSSLGEKLMHGPRLMLYFKQMSYMLRVTGKDSRTLRLIHEAPMLSNITGDFGINCRICGMGSESLQPVDTDLRTDYISTT
eukprot:905037-Amphidinium_carterae.1